MSNEIRELYDFGDFRLDAARRILSRADQTVPLTSKAFETLLVLVRNRDRVLTKDELMKALWPDSFVEEVNLAQNVSALRKSLGETPGENRFIATIPGRGYRFVGEVSPGAEGGDEIVVARHTHAQVVVIEEKEDDLAAGSRAADSSPQALTAPQPNSAAVRWIVALLAVAAMTVAGVFLWKRSHPAQKAEEAIHSLAVLPFQPLAAGSDDDHLGLGVADAVITKLSNLRQLPVRPTEVAIRYADPKVDPLQAAREMGVDSVLTGRIQKDGDRIRVTVQLVRVRDGRALWAQSFDEKTAGIFAVEDSISEQVVQALSLNLAEQEKLQLQRHYTENIDAYRNYLEGRYAEFTFTRDGMNKAIEYFNRAISSDPGYALAYAGLADAYTTESDWLLAPREALPKAEAAARKALAFDNNLAEAHEALAHALLHEWRLPESSQEFHTALALNPGNVSTYFAYSEYLASVGQTGQAIATMKEALAIDPLSPEVNSFLAWDYYLERNYSSCILSSRMAMQTFPDFWLPHMAIAMCYYMLSNYAQALDEYNKALAMNPESTFSQAGIAMSFARSGKRAEALKALDVLKSMSSRTYVSPAYVGLVHLALGDPDSEYAWLEKGYDDQAEWLLWLPVDPLFDGQRSDPRYKALVRKVGATR